MILLDWWLMIRRKFSASSVIHEARSTLLVNVWSLIVKNQPQSNLIWVPRAICVGYIIDSTYTRGLLGWYAVSTTMSGLTRCDKITTNRWTQKCSPSARRTCLTLPLGQNRFWDYSGFGIIERTRQRADSIIYLCSSVWRYNELPASVRLAALRFWNWVTFGCRVREELLRSYP